MTEQDILDKIAAEGWTVLKILEIGQEGTSSDLVVYKTIDIYKLVDNTLQQKLLKYFLKVDGTCYWKGSDPFPVILPSPLTFDEEVQNKITDLVSAATIKAGYIEKVDVRSKTALVVVIKTDNTVAMYHVYKVEELLTVTALTGTYPI